jgi:cold shock CspA family protein
MVGVFSLCVVKKGHDMSRKQRERERERERKERKRQRADIGRPQSEAEIQAAHQELMRVAAEIADQLGETEPEPRMQIERLVQHLGAESALAWLHDTEEIEAAGGIMLPDGSRRKTPGGVYFKLVRERIPKPQMLSIFYPDYEQTFPLDEQELTERLAGVSQWPLATAQSLRFSLVGRPARIAPPDTPAEAPYVVFELRADPKGAPAFNKALPPVSEATTFRVLAPTRQWQHVATALIERPDAKLLVYGYPAPDSRSPGTIVVYATNIHILGRPAQPEAPKGKRKRAAPPPTPTTGTVNWFIADKGYGFLTTDQGSDVFVHAAALAEGRTALPPGERVYFGVREGRKGPEATDVHLGALPPPPGPALPTLALPHPAMPVQVRLKLEARPPDFAFLGRPDQPPSLIAFRAEAAPPELAEGLPAPKAQTSFAVLIPLKLWKLVRDELSADKETSVLVSGYCSTDSRTPGMLVVRAAYIDTTAQHQRRRAADHQRWTEKRAAAEAAEQEPGREMEHSP